MTDASVPVFEFDPRLIVDPKYHYLVLHDGLVLQSYRTEYEAEQHIIDRRQQGADVSHLTVRRVPNR